MLKLIEFEKQLREKLDRLSDSVDCFDKIAEKAYSESDNADFYEDDFSVSGVENVTYTSKKRFRFAYVIAVMLVISVIVCIPTLKLTNLFGSDTKSYKERYNELLEELEYELNEYTYIYNDYNMEDFNHLSLFINPLYNYQYDIDNTDNRYVRVYTKLLTNDVIKTTDLGLYNRFYRTNQIYLVEYEDYYDENNIISIIDSDAKFNHDDIEECMNQNIHEFDLYINEVNHDFLDIINMNFLSDDKDTISLMFKENTVTASSFVYKSFYKLNGKIYPMLTDTLLLNLSNNYSYSYEIRCSYIENDGKICDFDTSWLVNQWNKIGCKYNNRVSKLKENDNFIKFSEKGMNLKSDGYICEYLPTTLAKNTFYYLKNDEEIASEYVIPYFACQFSAYGFESDSVSGLIKSSMSEDMVSSQIEVKYLLILKHSNEIFIFNLENQAFIMNDIIYDDSEKSEVISD